MKADRAEKNKSAKVCGRATDLYNRGCFVFQLHIWLTELFCCRLLWLLCSTNRETLFIDSGEDTTSGSRGRRSDMCVPNKSTQREGRGVGQKRWGETVQRHTVLLVLSPVQLSVWMYYIPLLGSKVSLLHACFIHRHRWSRVDNKRKWKDQHRENNPIPQKTSKAA